MTLSEFQTDYLSQQPFMWLALAVLLGVVIGIFMGRWLERSRRVTVTPVPESTAEIEDVADVALDIASDDFAISQLPNMDSKQLKRLSAHGIQSVAQLREATATKKQRESLADELQLEDFVVNKWARMADFLQLDGMTPEIAEFLVFAGINSTTDLASRNTESVAHKLQNLNDKESRIDAVPSRQQLQDWVDALGVGEG